MRVLSLKVKNFRNHSSYSLVPHKNINVILGKNGQGKTSLIETCSLLLTGGSFRQGKNWIQYGKDSCQISLEFENQDGKGKVSILLDQEKRPQYLLNGKTKRDKILSKVCVFFVPEDLASIRGDASNRRNLIDEMVISSQAGKKILLDFKRVLFQKNRFLKMCKKGHYSNKDQSHYLLSLNQAFWEKSVLLIKQRFDCLAQILPLWRKEGAQFLQTNDFEVQYTWQKGEAIESPDQAAEKLQKELQDKESLEKLQGLALCGPHRHDLSFFCYKKEARWSLSHGQQRALILSWKMAQWKLKMELEGEAPILFLDDVFSEIDQHFRKNLIQFLVENQAQVFITTNEWREPKNKSKINLIQLGE